MKPKELLNALVQDIAAITGDATSEAQAIAKGKESYLYLEYASVYGGYRLVRVKVVNGGHSNALPGMSSIDARLKAPPAMEAFLRAIIIGLNYQKPTPAPEPHKVTDADLSDFYAQMIPFGSLDVDAAISTAKEAGESAIWAADQITDYVNETGTAITDIDCVACVYDNLLQIARNEITELTKYDLQNDCTVRKEIYTDGNYCATSYDSSTDALQELTSKLAESNVIIENCTEQLQWFLDQIGINQQAIEEAKKTK